jgi:hypothetical protein
VGDASRLQLLVANPATTIIAKAVAFTPSIGPAPVGRSTRMRINQASCKSRTSNGRQPCHGRDNH